FAPLDVTKFKAAFAANPAQVQAIFGSAGTIGSLGTYLTGVTGQPTTLYSGLAGTIPTISLLQNFENNNSSELTSLQAQVKLVTDGANQYADQLRKQFTSYEGQIAKYQALQSQLAGFFKNG
ncbi:MAG: flagellar filament capping protein FliD, partial [Candidatus Eremiobacteraeota bacterium]|nr:flagellar filament capping protein FliD [Candidatus Eremiobacteraeota bacterium]